MIESVIPREIPLPNKLRDGVESQSETINKHLFCMVNGKQYNVDIRLYEANLDFSHKRHNKTLEAQNTAIFRQRAKLCHAETRVYTTSLRLTSSTT
ncbi:hypothetical protein T265_10420 [Opisthorchis viverrini]|uniref:Uncharacterized protein n=1 Tax=Opisthorchis viverrini TaxID=6198 RepID=A0A074Z6P1_OPIVI|nr:hypothetical protein T265_10420 [Opisthorchis viverrini]KER21212.1 hypothetical protein T265_10420 [Opisthorchis viverrini]